VKIIIYYIKFQPPLSADDSWNSANVHFSGKSMIKIILNGKDEQVGQISLTDLLKNKNVNPLQVVVELNGKILKRDKLEGIMLRENDKVEVIRFVGGG
jgi:sulfur carrier protein